MGILISLIIGILLIESYAWLPELSKWILERAVLGVREEIRERCREEWNEGLDALPNTMLKLVHALSYICGNAVAEINSDSFAKDYEEIDGLVAGLSDQYQSMVKGLRAAEEQRRPESYFEDGVRHALKNAAATMERLSNHPNAPDLQHAISVVGEFGETAIKASKRARELLDVSLAKINDRLDHVGDLIQTASDKLCQAKELLRQGDVSSGALEDLTKSIRADLDSIKSIMAADDWGDDAAMRAHRNIMDAFRKAIENIRVPIQRATRQLSDQGSTRA
jgi:HPt (histidine-containing phosphotransfer) domain-containing protein